MFTKVYVFIVACYHKIMKELLFVIMGKYVKIKILKFKLFTFDTQSSIIALNFKVIFI